MHAPFYEQIFFTSVNTHVHADHVTGSGRLRQNIPSCKSVIAEVSEAKASVKVNDGDILKFGKFDIEVRATPGHTNGEFFTIEQKYS